MTKIEDLPARVQRTIKLVCENYGVTFEQMQKKTRKRTILVPRQIIMTVLRNLTKMSYAKIGAIFNRDHATAISSKKAIENQREYQPYLSQLYKAIYSGKTQELKITHPKIYNEYIGSNGVVNPKQNTNHIVGVHTSRPAQLPPEKDWIHPKKSPFKKHPNNPIKEDFIFPIF